MVAPPVREPRIRVHAAIRSGILYRQASVTPAPAGEVIWAATFLPVKRWRDVIPFMRGSGQVAERLHHTPGLIAYGVRADVLRKRFWTLSAWADRDAMSAFVNAEPHRSLVTRFADWAGPGAAFVEWQSAAAALDWDEALKRLKEPTFSYAAAR